MKSQTVTPDIRTVRGTIQSLKAERKRKQAKKPFPYARYGPEHECVGDDDLDLLIRLDTTVTRQVGEIKAETLGVYIEPSSECPFVEGDVVECEVDFSNLAPYTNWARNVRAAEQRRLSPMERR